MSRSYYRCGCCGAGYFSALPQDPERDKGFGNCAACHDLLARDWVKYGHPGPWAVRYQPTYEEAVAFLGAHA